MACDICRKVHHDRRSTIKESQLYVSEIYHAEDAQALKHIRRSIFKRWKKGVSSDYIIQLRLLNALTSRLLKNLGYKLL